MAVVKDPVGYANLALDKIGQKAIASMSPPSTPTEIIVARNFDPVRRSVLRDGVWNFAKKRLVITRDATAPAFDYTDRYLLPNDFIRFLSINGESEIYQTRDYDLSEGYLLLNADNANSVNIRYIADITDVTKWDSLFADLFVLRLAQEISFSFARDESVIARLDKLVMKAEAKALGTDGQERPPKRIQRSKYLAARQRETSYPAWLVDSE